MRITAAASIAAVSLAMLASGSPNDVLAQDLKAKFIEKVMEKFDKDGNGQLDAAEMRAAMEYRRKMQAERQKGEAKADDKPATKPKPTEAELLKMYDINRNGRLDPEERILAEQDQKKKDDEAKKDDEPKTTGSGGEESWDDFEKRLLVKYDANSNKKLDTSERRKATGEISKWRLDQRKIKAQKEAALRGLTFDQRRLLAMFDDNKNYKLDDDERRYASQQFKQLRKGGLESAVELRDRFMEQFDLNKNGKLDSKEKPAALQFVVKVAAQLQAANKAEKREGKKKPKGNRKDKKRAEEAKRLFGG
jgi:Ca2+-binding EF-hand superfamily protein